MFCAANGLLPESVTCAFKPAVPVELTGTLVAVQLLPLTVANTPLIVTFSLESPIVPLTVTFVWFNWSLEMGFIVKLTVLWTTVRFVVLMFPAASVAVIVTVFVPLFNGKLLNHTAPLRSTNPVTVLLLMVAVTVAVASSICACTVKLLPAIEVPFVGQTRDSTGAVWSLE
jgi:hypothetical protein